MTERKGNSCRHLDFTGLFGSIHLINNYYNLFTLDLKIQREKHHGVPKQLLTFVLKLLTLMVCASGVQQKPQDCHSCFQPKLASRARGSLSLRSGVKGQLGGAGYTAGSRVPGGLWVSKETPVPLKQCIHSDAACPASALNRETSGAD